MAESSTRFFGRWLRVRCSGSQGFLALLALGFLALSPCPGSGQRVQGRLEDGDTGVPVEGALVLLLDERGRELAGFLTNPSGLFLLRAPGPGDYRVRAERIGYETTESEPFTLQLGQQLGLRLETTQRAIELEELRVEGHQRCVVRPGEGAALASVWEEARKALTVQSWTERESSYRFRVTRYERELDPSGQIIRSESRRVSSSMGGTPIISLPAADLMEEGFIRRVEDGSYDYFGPDASVLLSDEFLDTHCFRLSTSPHRPDDIGLAFEPARARTVPDIQGTLWLERETARLKTLEYTYTWTPWPEAGAWGEGFVEFEDLPGGAWVVKSWWIRMPLVAVDRSRVMLNATAEARVVGIKEVGGGINEYASTEASQTFELPGGSLAGQVWDSTRQEPLREATVYLSGTSYSTRTNERGAFLLQDLPTGTFNVSFDHPRLDSLRIRPEAVPVEISGQEPVRMDLGVPSRATTLATLCPPETLGDGRGVLVGVVRGADGSHPMEGATVRVTWSTFGEGPGNTLRESRHEAETTTGSRGHYALCGTPPDTPLTVRAWYGGRSTDRIELRTQWQAYTILDLRLGGLPLFPSDPGEGPGPP